MLEDVLSKIDNDDLVIQWWPSWRQKWLLSVKILHFVRKSWFPTEIVKLLEYIKHVEDKDGWDGEFNTW